MSVVMLDLMMESELRATTVSSDVGYTMRKVLHDENGLMIALVTVAPGPLDSLDRSI
jgi:hypothetical protein